MSHSRSGHKNQNSFSLTKKNRQKSGNNGTLSSFTWQEQAYERLKVLYGVGKLLSSTDEVETTFPKILSLCAATFPFTTGVLIENRGRAVVTAVWNASNATQDQIDRAIDNAKESFIYLTDVSESDSTKLRLDATPSGQLEGIHIEHKDEKTNRKNYFVSPLIVDHLRAFGILQLEGSVPLDEKDLEFINALADLVSVAVDRHHKTKETSAKLSSSQTHVLNLESERELREKFVSLLTHDLRTPLTSIKMSAELIQRQTRSIESHQSLAARIVFSVNRADQMITDLLDANRIRSGEKLPLRVGRFDLPSLVKETLSELTSVHGNRFILKSQAQLKGYWDPKGIRRILENLCNNAIKYGSPNSPITISVIQEGKNAAIEVQNFGEVISRGDQKFLFQQFRRGRKAALGKKKGWGIGLTLVLGVAEAHGGSVKVESEIKSGTIFRIILPLDTRPFLPEEEPFEVGLRSETSPPQEVKSPTSGLADQ